MEVFAHSTYKYVTIVKVSYSEIGKIDFALCSQPAETLEGYYSRQNTKPAVLINGGFFNMSDGTTCMNFIDERQTISNIDWYKEGFGITPDNKLIYGNLDSILGVRDFVSVYPVLIDNGKAVSTSIGSEIDYSARRTAVGYNLTHVFIVLVDSPGLTFAPLKKIFIELGATYAGNLDGGGSTRGIIDGKTYCAAVYSRPVDNIAAIYLKEQPVVYYRVQLGAFSNKENADRFVEEVKGLPDKVGAGYRSSYVRFINGLYKVQVAAMSKKSGAETIVKDLKEMGYPSFITMV